MKTTLVVLCLLCATVAFGQSVGGGAVLNNEPQVFQFSSHPQRAAQQSIAEEQSLLENHVSVSAHGVRPLWEVAPVSNPVPLGDVARLLKKEHATAKKAEIVWEN